MALRPIASDERDDVELLFEFCVEGVALSAHSKNRARVRAWKDRVAAQARTALADAAMLDGGVVDIRLSEFSETRRKDRDNFAKPIQDALQGILFRNDRQVLRLEVEWCDINSRYRVRFMSEVVAAALTAGREFVWIRIYRHRPRETLTP